MYIYIGQYGVIQGPNTYNGGGRGPIEAHPSDVVFCSAGGATDIRLDPGEWNSLSSLKSRIIVAGGGAGRCNYMGIINGNDAGIYEGFNGSSHIDELFYF